MLKRVNGSSNASVTEEPSREWREEVSRNAEKFPFC